MLANYSFVGMKGMQISPFSNFSFYEALINLYMFSPIMLY